MTNSVIYLEVGEMFNAVLKHLFKIKGG